MDPGIDGRPKESCVDQRGDRNRTVVRGGVDIDEVAANLGASGTRCQGEGSEALLMRPVWRHSHMGTMISRCCKGALNISPAFSCLRPSTMYRMCRSTRYAPITGGVLRRQSTTQIGGTARSAQGQEYSRTVSEHGKAARRAPTSGVRRPGRYASGCWSQTGPGVQQPKGWQNRRPPAFQAQFYRRGISPGGA
jgi:hypothetical protein